MNFETTVFVPNGESRKETAVLLVGTAKEYGIDPRQIRVASNGFYITEALADLLYDEMEQESPAEPEPATKKTSGNRAAKNRTNEE